MTELAHFTKISTLTEHILPTMELRASNLESLNDPLENRWDKRDILSYQSIDGAAAPTEYSAFYLAEEPNLARHFKIACFSHSNHHLNNSDAIPAPQENLRMWAEYGGEHTGACIIFNKEQLIYKVRQQFDKGIFDNDVLYSNELNGHASYTSHNISEYQLGNKNIEDFFHENVKESARYWPHQLFTKRIEWRDEREYRIAFYVPGEEFHFLNVRGTVEKIYLGLKCNNAKNIADSIRAFLPDCKISKLEVKNLQVSEIEL